MKPLVTIVGCAILITLVSARRAPDAPTKPLAEFAYRTLTLRCSRADGTPPAGASVYGFCRDLNLIWPRRDDNEAERNSVVWQSSYLHQTAADGAARITVPPGKWAFFAVGKTA